MSNAKTITLRLGTRGSMLGRTQSQVIADELEKLHPHLAVELVIIKTTGDQVTDRPLYEVGGKGVFTKEIEQALLAGEVDFAVHSFKDVPVTMPLVDQSDLMITATPLREDPSDVLICRSCRDLAGLGKGARVGTGSLRRQCQILDIRPDLQILPLRGNIDTRLKKLEAGEFDAIILAYAGLHRGGLFDRSYMSLLSEMIPAPGQGALALQCRRSDRRTAELLGALNDPVTERCVAVERKLVELLHGDCHSPIAARARLEDGQMRFSAAVGGRNGVGPVVRAESNLAADPEQALAEVHKSLLDQGALELLGLKKSRKTTAKRRKPPR